LNVGLPHQMALELRLGQRVSNDKIVERCRHVESERLQVTLIRHVVTAFVLMVLLLQTPRWTTFVIMPLVVLGMFTA
jgi:hypothetical protein